VSKENAIELIKQMQAVIMEGGPYRGYGDLERIRKELEEHTDQQILIEAINDMCAQEYHPKCSWCNDYLQSKHPFHDVKGEYCSVACMLISQDHEKIAVLEAWKAKMEGNICNDCLEHVP